MAKPNHNFELLRKVRGDLDELLTEFVTTQKIIGEEGGAWARLATYTAMPVVTEMREQVTENESNFLGTRLEVIYRLTFDGPAILEAKLKLILLDDGGVSVHAPNLNDIEYLNDTEYVHKEHGNPFEAGNMRKVIRPLIKLLHAYEQGNGKPSYFGGSLPVAGPITNESYKGLKAIRPEVTAPAATNAAK